MKAWKIIMILAEIPLSIGILMGLFNLFFVFRWHVDIVQMLLMGYVIPSDLLFTYIASCMIIGIFFECGWFAVVHSEVVIDIIDYIENRKAHNILERKLI